MWMRLRWTVTPIQTRHEQILWHGLESKKEITFTKEPYTGFWTRFGIGFLKILPIDAFL